MHKTANVLDKLPKSRRSKAKRALQEIWRKCVRDRTPPYGLLLRRLGSGRGSFLIETAKAMEITVPTPLLGRADEVIE